MTPVGEGAGDHTRQALANIRTVLEEAGSSLQNMVKATVFLTDMADYAAHNAAWCEIVQDPKPARSCVCVKELPFKTDVSIQLVSFCRVGGGGGEGNGYWGSQAVERTELTMRHAGRDRVHCVSELIDWYMKATLRRGRP